MTDLFALEPWSGGHPNRGRTGKKVAPKIPLETKSQILAALEEHESIKAVARAAGVHQGVVTRRMKQCRVTWHTQPKVEQTKTARQLIRERYADHGT